MRTSSAAAMLAVASLSLMGSGCTYVDPFIRLDAPAVKPAPNSPLPQVEQAVAALEYWQSEAISKRDGVTKEQRYLNLATFGLATGAAVAPLYKAHRDLTMGFTLGAGATYTGTSLFAPVSTAVLYDAAASSFQCVADRGRVLMAAAVEPDQKSYSVEHRECLVNTAPYETAVLEWHTARTRALSQDSAAATKLRQAGRETLSKLSDAIIKSAPSPEGIIEAAKSATRLSISTVPDKGAGEQKSVAGTCQERYRPGAEAQAANAIQYLNGLKSSLYEAINGVGDLGTACRLLPPTFAALFVSSTTVSLVKDASVNVTIIGGRTPYIVDWEASPGKGVLFEQHSPTSITLRATSEIAAGDAEYKLLVRDTAAAPSSVTIIVKVHGAAK